MTVEGSTSTQPVRRWVLEPPGGIDRLVLRTNTTIHEPGPGEIVVRIRAASLNYRDYYVLEKSGSRAAKVVPLSDGAGEVVAKGDGTRVRVGDRVCVTFFTDWVDGPMRPEHMRRMNRGSTEDGMLADLVIVAERDTVPVPEHLSFVEAATLPCAAVTAWHALTGLLPITAGSDVLVQGSGGVAVFGLQFAQLLGARVFATTTRPAKESQFRLHGAAAVLDATGGWDQEVRALTDGLGVDCVIDVGGPSTLARSVRATKLGGRVASIGVRAETSGEIEPLRIIGSGVVVESLFVGSRAQFVEMNRAIALHTLRPVIDRVFDFEQAVEAFEYLAQGDVFGKIVLSF